MSKTMMKPGPQLAWALAAAVLAAGPAVNLRAQEKSADELEKQIQDLKQTLEDLKRTAPTNDITPTPVQLPAAGTATTAPRRRVANPDDPIEQIREEGMNHSQVMKTLSYLSDVIGARLTGSPNLKRANNWTKDQLTSWGLENAHLEAWGPFGRGWELKRFSAQVIEPQDIPIKAYPAAWSPGFNKPIEAEVVYIDATNTADLDKYKGKLKGAVVLAAPIRPVRLRWEPMPDRFTDADLLEMADADVPQGTQAPYPRMGPRPTNAPAAGQRGAPGGGQRGRGGRGGPNVLAFAAREGAALIVNPSGQGDSGTIFVQSATVPPPANAATNTNAPVAGAFGGRGGPSAYATNAPEFPAQITVAAEDYNRLVRMALAGEKMKMAVDLQVKFHNEDVMAYNTVAEIPGTDLKDEIVMLGGHMDSWQAGTGATDNGAGVAAAMEAVRIIKALNLKPRRTIRIALWSGEEEGLLGSRAYVSKHFGYMTNLDTGTNAGGRGGGRGAGRGAGGGGRGGGAGANANRKLVKGQEFDQLSAYFNLDNGGGRIRGIFMQGNEAVRPLFRKWLDPFRDLDASTISAANTGSTDHVSFDNVGLPGFQFIQDELDYASRTHHSSEDVFDRIQEDDMKQASTILAAFVYQAAMLDDKLPRKSMQ